MTNITFAKFGLNKFLLKSLNNTGYLKPSPIQKKCIPYLLTGKDVLGIAQTGSGKTAAFILPLLNNLNLSIKATQVLILTPTRELAIQVAEATLIFAKYIHGVNIAPLYGGQSYHIQLKNLRLGVQIIIATPGRLLDHIKKKTVNLTKLRSLVIDEADEMLRMGFIEDVEKILSTIPKGYQTSLFSATMPQRIKNITKKFMIHPYEIFIKTNIKTIPDIKQTYWIIYGKKIDALMKFLETENFDAVLIFVKMKTSTIEISDILKQFGYDSAPLNGDMKQSNREQTLEKFRNGKLKILIATDIAARGLDVDKINLVINYDFPMDIESYIHRIGRTGRAGRQGKSLTFIEYREKRLLKNIERRIKCNIREIVLPNSKILCQKRLEKFITKVQKEVNNINLKKYKDILSKILIRIDVNQETLMTILLKMAQEKRPLILPPDPSYNIRKKFYKKSNFVKNNYIKKYKKIKNYMDIYRINIGKKDKVEVRHIVGAIINEFNINSNNIGNIKLFTSYSTIELNSKIKKNIIQYPNIRILNKKINFILIPKFKRSYKNLNFKFKNNKIIKKDI
ncbi:DEAD/DEAH box helicase [Enterobacteriaceae endosymbiont of Donacia versicolorea]|uniref:DEAD/DEAH box helicase n=1 Tax=Enterobacteriaceae endosymbiont of Donacia versicolorea TaxID=2675788 RepID=UPI001449A0B0|nr:DEAD/DEAH box helicase [Enterobacteriaceae endosymbiont of Donacia versicolorea]QJC32159.1 DEAD/DEAH box helicase [Enterobacteriaceae endosymbiont of Donacia versicolorea]